MEFFKYTRTFNFMGKSKFAFVISIVLLLASYGLLFTKGLNYGVDFAGGTIVRTSSSLSSLSAIQTSST